MPLIALIVLGFAMGYWIRRRANHQEHDLDASFPRLVRPSRSHVPGPGPFQHHGTLPHLPSLARKVKIPPDERAFKATEETTHVRIEAPN
ncbi:hypothetical protein Stube_05210 [Streptomyces tubercidicus]|uniref:Uncharacterized protein n=1 Tax=Streptomyces tubercidicus TaxID=47759 RepID=A0A640UIH4_9ACTN|nr:hypothetical protein Stube_05210 [Streptomyces tubercidicus]